MKSGKGVSHLILGQTEDSRAGWAAGFLRGWMGCGIPAGLDGLRDSRVCMGCGMPGAGWAAGVPRVRGAAPQAPCGRDARALCCPAAEGPRQRERDTPGAGPSGQSGVGKQKLPGPIHNFSLQIKGYSCNK